MTGRRLLAGLVLLAISTTGACTVAQAPETGRSPASSVPLPVPPALGPRLPAPGAPIPGDPVRLAAVLVSTDRALHRAIRAWVASGVAGRGSPPVPVELLSLYEQRAYRTLALDGRLARATFVRLPRRLAAEVRDTVAAGADLFSLARRSTRKPVPVYTQHPRPAGVLLGWFKEAERRFGVTWQVLAAVMFVESKFGRVRSASPAGAQGPMQFLPSTWSAYGLGGDVHDPHDAVVGAANYLHASGAPADDHRALFAYNPAVAYVDAVLRYAGVMRRDPFAFFAYYNWQVFVRTAHGFRRLTGPGL